MNADTAIWLADLIARAVITLEDGPCVTIECADDPCLWLQVLPEASETDGTLSGFLLNFPYRGHQGDPMKAIRDAGLVAPPDTQTECWEDGGYATIAVRPDVPLVGLAHFVGDLLERIVGASTGTGLTVQIEYGF